MTKSKLPKTVLLKKELSDLLKQQKAETRFELVRPKTPQAHKQLYKHVDAHEHRGELGNMSAMINGTEDVIKFRILAVNIIPASEEMSKKYDVDECYSIEGKFFSEDVEIGILSRY